MKQLAVEWLKEQYDSCPKYEKILGESDWVKAKEMNKDNIEYICVSVIEIMLDNLEHGQEFNSKEIFEKVYTETFKSE